MTVKECLKDAGPASGVLDEVVTCCPSLGGPMTHPSILAGQPLLEPVDISPSFRNLSHNTRAVLKTNAGLMTMRRRSIDFEMSPKHQL